MYWKGSRCSDEQGGVRSDGEKVEAKGLKRQAGTYLIQVGKRRAARVTVVAS